jgi:1,4-alpha-glucan branching enzyme
MGSAMYDHMHIDDDNIIIDRGMALIKMIRLITLATAGNGYLNFMGNEFGHPEWIDFPREENGWSYKYARRQWHLLDDPYLKYGLIAAFDRDTIALAKTHGLLKTSGPSLLYEHIDDKVIAFGRGGLVFVFNFHPNRSHVDYRFEAGPGKYRMVLNSDDTAYGGHGRLTPEQVHFAMTEGDRDYKKHFLSLYIPTRTAIVLEPGM